jgi:hypothetical protein
MTYLVADTYGFSTVEGLVLPRAGVASENVFRDRVDFALARVGAGVRVVAVPGAPL